MSYTNRSAPLVLCALAVAASAWAGHPGKEDKFGTMDANGDGTVTADEHANAVKAMFDRVDADRDGTVTAAEMEAGHNAMGAMEHPPGQHGAMDRKVHQGSHGGMDHGMAAADRIARMDTNGDGVLSASEHASGAQTMFTQWDTDRSGGLSRQEMDAGHAREMKGDTPRK